ncbi:Uncharacterised protein [Chromobacterium vaccinii]|nr:Uncharacterised protein [Chromobacterium vaccinii]
MVISVVLIGGSPFGWGWLLVIVTFLLGLVAWANASDGRPMFDATPPEKHSAANANSTTDSSSNELKPTASTNNVESSAQKGEKPTGGVRLNGALQDLRDMCQEMVSDGLMEESEVRELARYLDDHPWVESDGLIKLMADYIREVLADGEVTPMEGMDVLDLAAAVAAGKTLKDMRSWQPLAPVVDDEPPKVKRRSKVKSSKRKEGRTLDTIRFTYRDSKGDYSDRRVVVNVLDEEYFQGFCLSRNATRSFRLDRIVGDVTSETTGEIAPTFRWADQIRQEGIANRL